jgi:hypothetical protein
MQFCRDTSHGNRLTSTQVQREKSGTTTFNILTFIITTLGILDSIATLSNKDNQHSSVIVLSVTVFSVCDECRNSKGQYDEYRYAECHYDECRTPNVITLRFLMLNIVMLGGFTLNVVMLSVVAPTKHHYA